MTRTSKTNLLILGVYPESEGYPNIKYRLRDLVNAAQLAVEIIHVAIWPETISNQGKAQFLKTSWRFVIAHVLAVFKYWRSPYKTRVYIPYPAVFIGFLISCLPKSRQPERLFIDAFISLYDTVCIDRRLMSSRHILAKVLFWIERRAYQHCQAVIVDTEQNADYLSQLFALPRAKFVAIPLSTHEQQFSVPAYVPIVNKPHYQVLFIGTLIPLHGLEVILGAMQLLSTQATLHFKIIGNGQLAPLIDEFMRQQVAHVEWIKDWQSQAQLLEAINEADICLGIFGTTPKAQRVCPLKIYSYAACGRAVITADTEWMRHHVTDHTNPPFVLIPAGSPVALANALNSLISEPQQIQRIALAGQAFYQQQLSNRQATTQFINLINDSDSFVI